MSCGEEIGAGCRNAHRAAPCAAAHALWREQGHRAGCQVQRSCKVGHSVRCGWVRRWQRSKQSRKSAQMRRQRGEQSVRCHRQRKRVHSGRRLGSPCRPIQRTAQGWQQHSNQRRRAVQTSCHSTALHPWQQRLRVQQERSGGAAAREEVRDSGGAHRAKKGGGRECAERRASQCERLSLAESGRGAPGGVRRAVPSLALQQHQPAPGAAGGAVKTPACSQQWR